MATFLFNEIIFGPVKSRRLGVSLGINLLPVHSKYCNFNCIYCECGWSNLRKNHILPARFDVINTLKEKLIKMNQSGKVPDVMTFAGNGEPTLHPEFDEIIRDTIRIRDEYCPSAKIAVLSNSTLIYRKKVASALSLVDQNILKLDTVSESTFRQLNNPSPGLSLDNLINNLTAFRGKLIIQTMFVRGIHNGVYVDNSTEGEIEGLIQAYKKIQPESIMIYTYQRDTAAKGLEKISRQELERIGDRVRNEGFRVEISS